LKLPKGEAARNYNTLQKLAYLGVLGVLLPVMILAGLTMSPAMDAAWPWLLDLFGGRQSARSIHFITAFLLVLFVVVHLAMVVLAGPFNEIRSMITGRYRLPKE
jgi:thiosulfate reductase cytochrome b subunit